VRSGRQNAVFSDAGPSHKTPCTSQCSTAFPPFSPPSTEHELTASFYRDFIGCHRLPFTRDLHSISHVKSSVTGLKHVQAIIKRLSSFDECLERCLLPASDMGPPAGVYRIHNSHSDNLVVTTGRSDVFGDDFADKHEQYVRQPACTFP
jgi:hypothetical protein